MILLVVDQQAASGGAVGAHLSTSRLQPMDFAAAAKFNTFFYELAQGHCHVDARKAQ